jgi:hypothetical protein
MLSREGIRAVALTGGPTSCLFPAHRDEIDVCSYVGYRTQSRIVSKNHLPGFFWFQFLVHRSFYEELFQHIDPALDELPLRSSLGSLYRVLLRIVAHQAY